MDLYLESWPTSSFCSSHLLLDVLHFFPSLYPTTPDILTYKVPSGWKKSLAWWKLQDSSMFSDSESAEMTEALLISVNTWNESVDLLFPYSITAEP